MAVRRLTVQTGPRGAPGSGRCALSLVAWRSMGSYDGAWRRTCAAMVARADLRLAKQQFPTDRDMRISHEAIYRSLFVQTRVEMKKELTAQLRTRRQMRHAKRQGQNGQGHILDMVSIRDRPAEAEDRAVPGHWEGDSYRSKRHAHRDARRTPPALLMFQAHASPFQTASSPASLRSQWDQGEF